MRQLVVASVLVLTSANAQRGSTNVVMASGALQRCIGSVPGSGKMQKGQETEQYCHQLPAADVFDQAGARFKAGDHAGAARILERAAQAGNALAQLRLAIMYENGDEQSYTYHAAYESSP